MYINMLIIIFSLSDMLLQFFIVICNLLKIND